MFMAQTTRFATPTPSRCRLMRTKMHRKLRSLCSCHLSFLSPFDVKKPLIERLGLDALQHKKVARVLVAKLAQGFADTCHRQAMDETNVFGLAAHSDSIACHGATPGSKRCCDGHSQGGGTLRDDRHLQVWPAASLQEQRFL